MSNSTTHHSHHSKTSKLSNTILSFFLALFLFIDLVLIVAGVTLFSQRGFLSVFDNAYYEYMLKYVNEQTLYYTLPTGYDEAVLDGVFTLAEVKADADGFVTAAFKGATYKPDESSERDRIMQNVSALYARDGVEFNDEAQASATAYADELMAIYNKAIELPGASAIGKLSRKLRIIDLATAVVFAIMSIGLAVTLVAPRHFKHRGLRYVAYGTGGAALLAFVGPAALLVSGFYKGLNVTPQYFYHFCMLLIERLIHLCLLGAGVCLIVTIIIAINVARMRRQYVKTYDRGRQPRSRRGSHARESTDQEVYV